jgi:hypothetical protein
LDPSSTAIPAHLDLDAVRQSVERATAAMFEAAGLRDPAAVIASTDIHTPELVVQKMPDGFERGPLR